MILQAAAADRPEADRTDAFLDSLHADGPAGVHAEKLMLFGQFVGAWEADVVYSPPGGERQEVRAEWVWGWILQGRAIQDVFVVPTRVCGTTVRLYDPGIDAWRIVWHSATGGLQTSFIGRQLGEEIVLEATESDTKWLFSEVTATGYHWCAEESGDVVQTMDVRRVS